MTTEITTFLQQAIFLTICASAPVPERKIWENSLIRKETPT